MKLSEVCTVLSGLSPRGGLTPSEWGLLAIQMGDISPDGSIDRSTVLRISDRGVSSRHLIGPGDVLFRSRGIHTYASVVDDQIDEPAVAVTPLFIIRPLSNTVDPRYLAWFLNQPAAQRHFTQGATGTSLRMIKKPVLDEVPLDLPSLDTQALIAEVAGLANREKTLVTRLSDRRLELITSKLVDFAHATSNSTPQDRKN